MSHVPNPGPCDQDQLETHGPEPDTKVWAARVPRHCSSSSRTEQRTASTQEKSQLLRVVERLTSEWDPKMKPPSHGDWSMERAGTRGPKGVETLSPTSRCFPPNRLWFASGGEGSGPSARRPSGAGNWDREAKLATAASPQPYKHWDANSL